jgi:cysteine sulfinate desulfinase/cysteine desulfurase-like protein
MKTHIEKFKASADYTIIKSVIERHYHIRERIRALSNIGYDVEHVPMGSGGVGQIKNVKNAIRMQISCGHGKHNYANAVVIPL